MDGQYKDKIAQMSLFEKASLVCGDTPFGTKELKSHNILKMLFLDGGTGMNFEQLFGELTARSMTSSADDVNQDTQTVGGMTSSLMLKHVIDYYYDEEKLSDGERQLREWINDRLEEFCGDDYVPGCFPPGILLGATWNPQIVAQVGEALGMEALHFGVNLLLGSPYVNLMRDPLNGRLFESYSEDPLLMSKLAPEIVKGVQKYGVAANVKHFAANNQETFRVGIDETISRRALEELYLPAFHACVDAGVATVMSAYNAINGIPCTENHWLLTELLRDQWGFDGMVISDWGAVYHPGEAVAAGNDVAMPGPLPAYPVVEAVEKGILSEETLDASVERILKFHDSWGPEAQQKKREQIASKANAASYQNKPPVADDAFSDQAAYNAVIEGAVLLKNENDMFPLHGNVLLAGKGAMQFYDCGTGSAGITTNRTGSLYLELKKRMDSTVFYAESGSIPADGLAGYIADTDNVLIVVRQLGMEGNDRKSLKLPEEEYSMLIHTIRLAKQQGKRTGVILNVCGPVDCSDFIDDADGVFCVFLPGMQGASALADLLTGKANPSGKLPVTFPYRYEDTPTCLNFPGDGKHVIYGEDIFVGYRYYDTKGIQTLFPFGYGLSYTCFHYSNIQVSEACFTETLSVSVEVTNTGSVAGKETVQLYVHDVVSTLRKPQKELKDFKKIYLEPGETKQVCFLVTKAMLASYDTTLSRWEAEEGYFDIMVGASSRDIRQVKRVYGDWRSAYSYSVDSSFKVLYEHREIQPVLFSFFEELGLDKGILYSNYEYTPFKTLGRVLEEAGITKIPQWFTAQLEQIKKE